MNAQAGKLDILITGGILLAMATPGDCIADPMIGIRGGKIAFVGRRPIREERLPEAYETIDATGCLIMPGLVNTHTHLPMVLFRGLADDLPLMSWLNDHIFPAEERFINRETVYDGAMLAIAEMILSGTTAFCDGYFFEDAVAQATLDAGMRGVLAQGFIDFPEPDQRSSRRHSVTAEAYMKKWLNVSPLVTPALVCHSPYTCTPETLTAIKEVARRNGALFIIHLAETREEVAIIRERFGKKPVQHLHHLKLLDEATIAAHCIWIDRDEIDLLADYGAKVAHDPESNMKLGAGVAPVPAMLKKGITVGLGTDGSASNNNLDLFGEMGMCAKVHKLFSSDPTALAAESVVEMATMGGAKVLGLGDEIGSIVEGKLADIILVGLNRPHLTPLYNPYSHLVYAASGADVQTSIIGGKIVMRDRRLLTIDVETVMDKVRTIGRAIMAGGFRRAPYCR